jgi:hypothetical protein
MAEGFIRRMGKVVGDENTVARYLVEKVGHTALIAWSLAALSGLPSLLAAGIATVGYVVVGKALWLIRHHTFDARDFLFDLVVGSLVPIIVVPSVYGWPIASGLLAVWCVVVLVGSNNQWGKPS